MVCVCKNETKATQEVSKTGSRDSELIDACKSGGRWEKKHNKNIKKKFINAKE